MILTTALALSLSQTALDDVRLIRWPAINGDQYVFTYASDLWISSPKSEYARRLTSHPGLEREPHFSPDGKWIAFTGQYDGGNDVYIIPVEGGVPQRLTFDAGTEIAKGWTNDGRVAYVSSSGNHTNRMPRLWFVGKDGGLPERTKLEEVFDLSFSPDGTKMVYNRSISHLFNWRHYRGGTQGRISFWDFKTESYSEIPTGLEQNYFPMWIGSKVYFISDKNQNNLNLYSYDTGSKKITQITKFTDGDIRWPSTDGKKIIFERNLRIHTLDLASGKIETLAPKIITDMLPLRERYVNLGNQIDTFALSPSGARLVVQARGELFSVPASNGNTRNLSQTQGAMEQLAEWSADGQWVYYISDVSGEDALYRRPQMGGDAEKIALPAGDKVNGYILSPKGGKLLYTTIDLELKIFEEETKSAKTIQTDSAQRGYYEWSADGKWVTYVATQENLQSAVMIYDVEKGTNHQVTSGFYNDAFSTFDLTGKYLYIISSRTFSPAMSQFEIGMLQNDTQRIYVLPLDSSAKNPLDEADDEEPVKEADKEGQEKGEKPAAPAFTIDFENMEARMIPLPMGASSYPAVFGQKNGVLYVTADGTLNLFSLASKRPAPIMGGIQTLSFNSDRTQFAYRSGLVIGIAPVQPGQQPGAGRVDTSNVVMQIDPKKEFEQMFWDVWRYERDEFYQPNMVGVDWKAIGDKYAAMLPYVGDRSDLDYIFGQLIGELGTGHAYVTPGPADSDPYSPPAGSLGADYDVVGGKVRFQKIYKGLNFEPSARGPLGALGVNVKEGDYLLAIDGHPVTEKTGVSQLLIGKAGQKVTLTVNHGPTLEGSHKVEVVPILSETDLRYRLWVVENRKKVEELSGGKIGYMHVPDTNVEGIIGFIRGFYSQVDKEAWIIDERYNGGGWIPTFFIEFLNREFTNVIDPRHGRDIGLPTGLDGPKAMLINQHAGSGGDLFPYLFKKAGLGPLIGVRTWGGLVGISGNIPLMAGGGVTAPAFGIYDPDTGKWIAENTGVSPDIQVDDRPDLAAKGQDPQLEAAVKYLLDQLAKGKGNKINKPNPPVINP